MKVRISRLLSSVLLIFLPIASQPGAAQATTQLLQNPALPSAPQAAQNYGTGAQSAFVARPLAMNFPQASASQTSVSNAQAPTTTPVPGVPMRLSRSQAEQLALKNNPRITVGHLLALAQHQVSRDPVTAGRRRVPEAARNLFQ